MNKIKDSLLFQIKQIVFGVQDGLVTTVILTTTLASVSNNSILIISAITAGIGGAISMATGTYLGAKSQKDVLKVKANSAEERALLIIKEEFRGKGVKENDIKNFSSLFSKYPEIEKELASNIALGVDLNRAPSPITDATFMGVSFLIGAIIPSLPYIILGESFTTIVISVILVAATLFAIGTFKTVEKGESKTKNGFEIMLIGMVAAILGFLIGKIANG